MAKASRNQSHIAEQLSGNCIFETWTQQWGLKIYPAYQIDKLKFSFIDKGSSGKGNSFDIFMECRKADAACFDNWAYDILHVRLERALAAEKQNGEKYPKAYAYATGENAEKHIGICNSTKGGYCINAQSMITPEGKNEAQKVYCNIPISFHSLRYIAEMYYDTYEVRRKELIEIWKKSYDDSRKYNKPEVPAQEQSNTQKEQTSAPVENKEQSVKKSEITAENFHHGNLKATQFAKINDTLACVRCANGIDLYLNWDMADKKSDKKQYEKFIEMCTKEVGTDSPALKKPISFKVMYLETAGKNYFYRFS